jgi:flavodoxin
MMTTAEAAVVRGYKVYDTALPQGWVDMIRNLTDLDVRGHFVWSYDICEIGGFPAPVTEKGDDMDRFFKNKAIQLFTYAEMQELSK